MYKLNDMLIDELKKAIAASGLTHYRIGKDAGVNPTVIDRFISGERGLNLETASKLASVLGLRLTEKSSKKSLSAH